MKIAVVLNTPDKLPKIEGDFIIVADGGLKHSTEQGITPDLLLGDLDSLGYLPDNIPSLTCDPVKNQTDGELAVEYICQHFLNNQDPDGKFQNNTKNSTPLDKTSNLTICFYGITGGRPDHVLGNIAVMFSATEFCDDVSARDINCQLHALKAPCNFTTNTPKGRTISIIPHGGDALISNSVNLAYPLQNLKLTPLDTRGISNITTDTSFGFSVLTGNALLVINSK
jgi:thiamine pyrophosphokinase